MEEKEKVIVGKLETWVDLCSCLIRKKEVSYPDLNTSLKTYPPE